MSCTRSRPAWRSTYPNENGKHPIRFGFRDTPPDYFIDCGRCEGCRSRQRSDWGVRMYHESKEWDRNCFVTLTYDDQHYKPVLDKQDVQYFIARLRKASSRKIRYYAVGEYGETTGRAHYHAIIFNEDFLGGAYDINSELYGNKHIENIWGMGQVSIAPFSAATAMYVAGYTAKKISELDTFSLQSRNPPIGMAWVRKHHDNIRRNENVVVEGVPHPIPKVYMNWLEGTESFEHIKENLAQKVNTLNDQQCRAKALNYKAKVNLKKERI